MIAIVSCTQLADYKQTLLYKSLAKLEDQSHIPFLEMLHFVTQNKKGLSEAYNSFLKSKNFTQILFVHDDIWIDDAGFLAKLKEGHEKYDIIGVAGGLNPTLKAPALWHIMCGGFQSGNLKGFAGHYLPDGTTSITNFGSSPARVAVIDGAFMSVNVIKTSAANWKFNENYTFHHYDLSSCIDANKLKLKIGVLPILTYHNSPGLRDINDKTFTENQAKFLKEYASY